MSSGCPRTWKRLRHPTTSAAPIILCLPPLFTAEAWGCKEASEKSQNFDFAESLPRASRGHQGYSGHAYGAGNILNATLCHTNKHDKLERKGAIHCRRAMDRETSDTVEISKNLDYQN